MTEGVLKRVRVILETTELVSRFALYAPHSGCGQKGSLPQVGAVLGRGSLRRSVDLMGDVSVRCRAGVGWLLVGAAVLDYV